MSPGLPASWPLLMLQNSLETLTCLAYRLHPLRGSLQGYWSIRVSGNWRITFRFLGNDIELVDYLDYH